MNGHRHVIIINADDWGRSRAETDAAMDCFKAGRITSTSAMVFMNDSTRAAGMALDIGIDVGLHLNFSERFNGKGVPPQFASEHEPIVRFLSRSRYAQVVYHPGLKKRFLSVYKAQAEEFERLYGRPPSHVDGHHHMHLCTNMLLDGIIPKEQCVRRSFSFWPGEKGILNRAYRCCVDRWLSRRYRTAHYFLALSRHMQPDGLRRVSHLAREASVELMTHPVYPAEQDFLASDQFASFLQELKVGTYASI